MSSLPHRPFHFKQDQGLVTRMFICYIIMGALYVIFISVLLYFGFGFFPTIILSIVMMLSQWYFSDRIVLWSSGAKVVSKDQYPKLHTLVENICKIANLPKPKIAIMNSNVPNAFATGKGHSNSLVAVSTSLLELLDEQELEGVIGHEISHIKSRDVLVLTLASIFSTMAMYLVRFGTFSTLYGRRGRDNNTAGIGVIIAVGLLTWVISFLIIRAISRYREYVADQNSAQLTGKPLKLASALAKISGTVKNIPEKNLQASEGLNAFFIIPALSSGTFTNVLSTHPPVEKRIEKLKEMELQKYD